MKYLMAWPTMNTMRLINSERHFSMLLYYVIRLMNITNTMCDDAVNYAER